MDSPYILPIKTPLDATFSGQIQQFLAQAQWAMPSIHQAALLKAAAGARVDQQVVAEYAIGLVWLSWRFDKAWPPLAAATNASSALIASCRYLQLQQELSLLKQLPLYTVPRAQPQPLAQMQQEARLIAYLTSGR